MSRSWKRSRVKRSAPEDEIRREEQGDLLADAVTGAFLGGEPGPEEEEGVAAPEAGGDEPQGASGVREELPPVARQEESPPVARQEESPPTPTPAPGVEGEPEPRADVGGRPVPAGEEDGEVAAETPIPPTPWEQKMAWAKERAREGRKAEAEELYRELLRENPESVRARNNLGILLDEKGDHEGAVAELRIARQLEPRNGEVLGNLGVALGALGRYEEAGEALRAAHRLDPSNPEIRANLGILYFRKGLYEQAEAELEAVCARDPDHGTALFYRGEALNRLGRVDEAIEVLSRAVELVPGNPRAYHTLGVLFDKKRFPERAALMYRKARELVAP